MAMVIDQLLEEQRPQSAADEQVNKLLSLAGLCEGGPSDLADNHEQYLREE